jgi:hypothetical protein
MPLHVKKNPIMARHWHEIYSKDLDQLIAVCGRRGFCKSGFAQSDSILFDWSNALHRSRFTLDKVVFKATDFIKHFSPGVFHPTGTSIIWDEVGVENDSRSWYSARNKLIKYLIETNRYRNYCVMLTAPTLKSFDISTQRCLTGIVNMLGKTQDGSKARGVYYQIETNYKGVTYMKRPRVKIDGRRYVVDGFEVGKPPTIFEMAYKKKKHEFVSNWNKLIDSEISAMEGILGEKKHEMRDLKELEREVLDNWNVFYDRDKEKFDFSMVLSELGIADSNARKVTSILNTKLARGFLLLKGDKFVDNTGKSDKPLVKEKLPKGMMVTKIDY